MPRKKINLLAASPNGYAKIRKTSRKSRSGQPIVRYKTTFYGGNHEKIGGSDEPLNSYENAITNIEAHMKLFGGTSILIVDNSGVRQKIFWLYEDGTKSDLTNESED